MGLGAGISKHAESVAPQSADSSEPKFLSRREALAAERNRVQHADQQGVQPGPLVAPAPAVAAAPAAAALNETLPSATLPASTLPAEPVTAAPAASSAPSAPEPAQPAVHIAGHRQPRLRPAKPRRVGARIASVAAMGVVAAFTVALSLPAEALMSSADVQAKQIAAASANTEDGQVILAGGGTTTVEGEHYDAETKSAYAAESGISRIEDTFTNDPNGTVQWPFAVGVHIGDTYGSTYGRSSAHHGQDFNPGTGAPIQAIADGVVSFAEDGEGDLGVNMMITHQINGQTVTSVYAHMIHGSMRFKVGDTVKVGQVIGNVGNTGYSTGPHLHFEIRLGGIDGTWTDPLAWLRANTN